MAQIITLKKGKLLEVKVDESGSLKETDVFHDPRKYLPLGIGTFESTIRLNGKTSIHPDIKKEYYSKLTEYASDLGANLFQIFKETPKHEGEWGVSYETMILMYVK